GEAGRPGRRLARGVAVRPRRRSRCGRGFGRVARSGCSYSRTRRGPLPTRDECMARFEKSRPKSTKPHAAVAPRPRASTAPSIEDTMFFPRLRRHAKWMFVLLALVFGLGFGGTGIGDIFRDQGGTSSGQSVSDAQKQAAENPKSAQAWRDLSTAYQT